MSQYTKLLCHFNGANASTTFTDETGSKTITAGGADANVALSTAQKKFGTASCYIQGTVNEQRSYISVAGHADFDFRNGDFTIDLWITPGVAGNGASVISSSGLTPDFSLYYNKSQLIFQTGYDVRITHQTTLSVGTVWHHIAFVKSGTTVWLFLDGVRSSSSYTTGQTDSWLNACVTNGMKFGSGSGAHSGEGDWSGYFDEIRVSKGIARWTADFTVPTSEYRLDLYQNLVITSPPNVRELINRIAYEASSLEYWDAGQHNLIYLPTHTTVTKTIDANRIDANSITVGYTDRVDLINTMTLWYYHYWAGYSGDAAFRKAIADSDATSITTFGTLESESLQFQTLLDDDNAQRALRWILTQQKNPRITVEFVGGYYLTDLRRSNLISFDFVAGDELDTAFSGLVSTSDKFIITDIVRGTGQIKIKAVQLVAL